MQNTRMAASKLAAPWYKTLMMCRPKYFDVKHRLMNVHMEMKVPVKKSLAQTQWENFYQTLTANNVKVDLIEPQTGLVDMVFTANAGIIHGSKAVVANFGAVPRRPESQYYVPFFKERGFEVIDPAQDGVQIEGCGDFMPTHDRQHFFVAHGFRSDFEAHAYLRDVLSIPKERLHHMELVNPNFYHIDTALMSMTRGHLMYIPEAFSAEARRQILEVGGDQTIAVSPEDAAYFACNSVNFEEGGQHLVIANKFTPQLRHQLTDLGYKVIETPYDQFLLSGGSVRCSVLDIGHPDPPDL